MTLRCSMDISAIIGDAIYAYKNIDKWVKPEKAPFDLNYFAFSPTIYKEPKGVVLIISPFNYPIWCLGPITGAIAAGCAAVVKPSELTPATSQLLAELFPKYLDQDLYRIVNGAIDETTKALSLPWDHILYTGSGRVGRIVATAAAKHLTPVTLELGGKSPVIVDSNVDFELTARRLLWGKSANCGQTCTAPDYVLIQADAQPKLIEALKKEYKRFFDDDPYKSNSYSRICAHSHWERINALLQETKGEVVIGGQTIKEEKYIAPTVITSVTFDDALMRDELFGPILPIITVPNHDVSLQYIKSHDTPLALYVFSKDSKFRAHIRKNTLSGSFLENDVILQGGSMTTPFGGVGPSGYGAHKGKYSFDTFVHHRPGFRSPRWIDSIALSFRFPPYTAQNERKFARTMMSSIPYPDPDQPQAASFSWKPWLLVGAIVAFAAANKNKLMGLVKR